MTSTHIKALALWLACCITAGAQLSWEAEALEFQPSPGDRNVVAVYKFQNTGSKTVHIKDLRTSCGCTTVAVPKTSYAPGEKGEVSVDFLFGGRKGRQIKTISVITDEPQNPMNLLTLVVQIPELLKIRPTFLFWRQGEEPRPKELTLTVPPGVSLQVRSVSSTEPRLATKLETVEEGREYTVEVTPTDTSRPARATFVISTASADGKFPAFRAYAQIK